MDPVDLAVFGSRVDAVCEEMGAALARAAFSPNIRDRLDYSCALFDARGELIAQAAHIPVHLGSMAYAMRDVVDQRRWAPGDVLVLNDPYLGGTHLPDVTLIAAIHDGGQLVGFAAARAHHADIGAEAPGSMPLSRSLDEEGLVIPPTLLCRADAVDAAVMGPIVAATRTQRTTRGDLYAQLAAVRLGRERVGELVSRMGSAGFGLAVAARDDYAERLARAALRALPEGEASFEDVLDDDGLGHQDLRIRVRLRLADGGMTLDFAGTDAQVEGNVNCPLSVAAAGAAYLLRCLLPPQLPLCAGALRCLSLSAPAGCLLNPERPAAVAAGNVETSMRVVDVLLGALAELVPERVPAAAQGSMNNLALGGERGRDGQAWAYYETLGGGAGAHRGAAGASAVHSHMTNTLNTPIEVMESSFPLRVRRYAIRRGSGGAGAQRGGDGLVRELELLAPASVTVIAERRRHRPWGAAGGEPGLAGEDRVDGERVPGKHQAELRAGQLLSIATPGGGGYGSAS